MKDIPEAIKIRKKRFSAIWLTPILAVALTGWLLYSGYINSGRVIRIQFDSGSDIIAGKTLLKYRGMPVGKVVDLEIDDSMTKVNVVVKLKKKADNIAKEGMQFWVVKPRVSINQITGLETIISGTYIEVKPPFNSLDAIKKQKDQDFFVGLSDPPAFEPDMGSVTVNLWSEKDYGIYSGMLLYNNNMSAGHILSVRYDSDTKKFFYTASVGAEYQKYLNSSTRFWNISGFDLKIDSAGLHVNSSSLNSVFQGGVAFDSDENTKTAKPQKEYEIAAGYSETLLSPERLTLYMPECYGIRPDRTPVMYKGMQAGVVADVNITRKGMCEASLRLNKKYSYLAVEGSRFALEQPQISVDGVKNLSSMLLGVFLNIEAGTGRHKDVFYLSDKPVVSVPADSLMIRLKAATSASADIGTGIYYRGVRIGQITDTELKGRQMTYDAAIFPQFRHLAVSGLYLWQPDLMNVTYGAQGINVSTEGLQSAVTGGISAGYFDEDTGAYLKKGDTLAL